MALLLNRCERCREEIDFDHLAYFRLNSKTDRFDLECENCYSMDEIGLRGIVLD